MLLFSLNGKGANEADDIPYIIEPGSHDADPANLIVKLFLQVAFNLLNSVRSAIPSQYVYGPTRR